MLATFGFALTGIMFGIFAYTFRRNVITHTKLQLKAFSYAYYALSLAFILWSVAAAVNNDSFLQFSVYLGDALILAGTVCMVYLAAPAKNRVNALYVAVVLSIILLALRAIFFKPNAEMIDGILLFNTQVPAAALLGGVFSLIWFPNNLRTSKQVTTAMHQKNIGSMYGAVYAATTFSALLFLSARRTLVVVSSFVILSLCILLLIASNILVSKVMEKNRGKHAKQPA